MLRREKNFQIVVYEAALLGDIRKNLKLLDNLGKYFYIKHFKDDAPTHYHIYFNSNSFDDELQIESIFLKYVSSRVSVKPAQMGKYPFIKYILQNGKYRMRDIKGTMSLA